MFVEFVYVFCVSPTWGAPMGQHMHTATRHQQELLHQHGMEGGSSVAPAPACSGGTPLLQQLQADCVYAMQLHRKAMRLLQEDNVPHTTIAVRCEVYA